MRALVVSMLGTVAVLAAVTAALVPVAAAGDAPVAEAPLTAEQLRARLRTTAWLPSWDLDRAKVSLRDRQRLVGRLSPFWFELRRDGLMVARRPGAFDREVLAIARTRSIAVVPTVTNDLDPARVRVVLASAESRRRHVDQLVAIASRSGFAGIDLDYEQVDAADRARFTLLVTELGRRLRARGLQLSVGVPPITSSAGDAVGTNAYDLRAIAAAADEVRVLAYDYSTPCTGSGPIAPIGWVTQVVDHVLTLVPAGKLVLGVPLYGYDWPTSGCAASRTWRDTVGLRRRHGGSFAWSSPFQTRQVRYTAAGVRHLVWFEDARGTAAKLRLAHERRLRGVAMWRLGGEDPQTWSVLTSVLGQPRR